MSAGSGSSSAEGDASSPTGAEQIAESPVMGSPTADEYMDAGDIVDLLESAPDGMDDIDEDYEDFEDEDEMASIEDVEEEYFDDDEEHMDDDDDNEDDEDEEDDGGGDDGEAANISAGRRHGAQTVRAAPVGNGSGLIIHGPGGRIQFVRIVGNTISYENEPHEHMESRRRTAREREQEISRLEPVPNPKGVELQESGSFASIENRSIHSNRKQARNLPGQIHSREIEQRTQKFEHISSNMVPTSWGKRNAYYPRRAYSGQFSLDGDFFYTCCQDFDIRLYDTRDPYDWKPGKTIRGRDGRWTITDATLSPGKDLLAYSSISPIVWCAPTGYGKDSGPVDEDDHFPLDFYQGGCRAGIWSIRFSSDSREVIAGAGDRSLYVYDMESSKVLLRLTGHDDDVNAVCFADDSSNVLFSGSDDSYVKVWDRRSMSSNRQAGAFVGHTEGITYIDSKGDGRYAVTNGKDQTCKLWDLRKMYSSSEFDECSRLQCSTGYDYRWEPYPGPKMVRRPDDCSVMTYRGHHVLRTLIRCHFSPAFTTGQQYIYSGSACGRVFIWKLDGTLVKKLSVSKGATEASAGRSSPRRSSRRRARLLRYGMVDDSDETEQSRACVRDASWHPYSPVMAVTAWLGDSTDEGMVSTHTWTGKENLRETEGFDMDDAAISDLSFVY